MDGSLTLGPITFKQFEIPSSIVFGGRQKLAIHSLLDGRRLVDVLGPEDTDITFSGIFSGPDAIARSMGMDLLRRTGVTIPLSWSDYFYSVIVRSLKLTYYGSNWIAFSILCTTTENLVSAATNLVRIDSGYTEPRATDGNAAVFAFSAPANADLPGLVSSSTLARFANSPGHIKALIAQLTDTAKTEASKSRLVVSAAMARMKANSGGIA